MPSLHVPILNTVRFRKVFRANDAATLQALINAYAAADTGGNYLRSVNPAGSSQGSTWAVALSGQPTQLPQNWEIPLASARFAFRIVADAAPAIEAAFLACEADLQAMLGTQITIYETILVGAGDGQTWLVGLVALGE